MSALLETRGLTKRFAGLTALEDVDFSLQRGELRAIIGPNGAGKTTFANLVCGRLTPSHGRIFFLGHDITNEPPHRRARRGIVCTSQITSIFPRLTVFDNVRVAVQSRVKAFNPFGRGSTPAADGKVDAILRLLALKGEAGSLAVHLSHGDQRRLEIAIALGLEPQLLLLDEPTQGMAPAEVGGTLELLRRLGESTTMLLIEHNMDVVWELARRITVFDRGRIIADGTPPEISGNPAVQQAYLGGSP